MSKQPNPQLNLEVNSVNCQATIKQGKKSQAPTDQTTNTKSSEPSTSGKTSNQIAFKNEERKQSDSNSPNKDRPECLEETKAILTNTQIQQKQTQTVQLSQSDEISKINQFFRYKPVYLLLSLNKKCYYQNVPGVACNGSEKPQSKQQLASQPSSQYKKKAPDSSQQEGETAQMQKLAKIVSTKSKYKHREKLDFHKSPLLKVLGFNFKEAQQKQELEDYKDLEDEYSEADKLRQNLVKQNAVITVDMVAHWKKVKGLPPQTRVFIVIGGYEDMIEELKSFGWKQNSEEDSLCFDLKWATKTKDIDLDHILENQVVNHFKANGSLTSKQGLSKNLKNLIWFHEVDCYKFFPRCYDLNDTTEFEDFIEEFKLSEAESTLKKLVLSKLEPKTPEERLKVRIALAGTVRKLQCVSHKVKNINKDHYPVINLPEWKALTGSCTNLDKLAPQIEPSLAKDIDLKRDDLLQYATEVLKSLEATDPQYHMNGINNLWVIKPSGLSRGRGIRTYSNLDQILAYVVRKDVDWVGQKYLENLYLINKKKFDIRQWVIITDWKPLTIWMYDENYVRMCVEELDLNSVSNKFGHLTNNCIQKLVENFEEKIDTSMMSQEDFVAYLQQHEGRDVYTEKIKPSIISNVINSMKSVVDNVVQRKNSIELYGYDFMIDQNFQAWLIEVNSSPSMEYSTKVTTNIVKPGLRDVAKLINNYVFGDRKLRKDLDTGRWKLIFKE